MPVIPRVITSVRGPPHHQIPNIYGKKSKWVSFNNLKYKGTCTLQCNNIKDIVECKHLAFDVFVTIPFKNGAQKPNF